MLSYLQAPRFPKMPVSLGYPTFVTKFLARLPLVELPEEDSPNATELPSVPVIWVSRQQVQADESDPRERGGERRRSLCLGIVSPRLAAVAASVPASIRARGIQAVVVRRLCPRRSVSHASITDIQGPCLRYISPRTS